MLQGSGKHVRTAVEYQRRQRSNVPSCEISLRVRRVQHRGRRPSHWGHRQQQWQFEFVDQRWLSRSVVSRPTRPSVMCDLHPELGGLQTTDERLSLSHTHTMRWKCSVLFFNRPRSESWSHHKRTFSIYLCRLSFWLTFHGESCPRPDVVHPGRKWSSSTLCTWHCSLHYLFLQATPLFPHGVTIVC